MLDIESKDLAVYGPHTPNGLSEANLKMKAIGIQKKQNGLINNNA